MKKKPAAKKKKEWEPILVIPLFNSWIYGKLRVRFKTTRISKTKTLYFHMVEPIAPKIDLKDVVSTCVSIEGLR